MSRDDLARRQADLVAALVAGAPVPPGFDERLIAAAATALAVKRAGEVAARWPRLRHEFGPRWTAEFRRWSAGRPPLGPLRDGWDMARAYRDRLGPDARAELAQRDVTFHYDGRNPPRRRRTPAARRAGAGVFLQFGGRVVQVRWPAREPT